MARISPSRRASWALWSSRTRFTTWTTSSLRPPATTRKCVPSAHTLTHTHTTRHEHRWRASHPHEGRAERTDNRLRVLPHGPHLRRQPPTITHRCAPSAHTLTYTQRGTSIHGAHPTLTKGVLSALIIDGVFWRMDHIFADTPDYHA